MSPLAVLFGLIMVALVFSLRRRSVPLVFITAASYLTLAEKVEIGPLSFPLTRIIILVGLTRALFRGERIVGRFNPLDKLLCLWSLWNVFTICFHKSDVLVFRLGILYDHVGWYVLFRIFIVDLADVKFLFKEMGIVLLPAAIMMLGEKLTGFNFLGLIGLASSTDVAMTNGHYRAAGAFGHPILAGTVGAVCLPMALFLYKEDRKRALLAFFSFSIIVFSSGSSGPIMASLAGFGAMFLWMFREYLKAIRWLAIFLVVALDIVMNDPVYFVMARIDITGGSTGYFRAQLIRSAIEHINEWWLIGTDYTRHWMPSGITANNDHTDMTNYYLQIGVWGGLLLVGLFIAMHGVAFSQLGKMLKRSSSYQDSFLLWTLGAILFAHVVTFTSISYFDQTIAFLYFIIGGIGTVAFQRQAKSSISPSNSVGFSSVTSQSCFA
jgi:hypothetical protein